MKKLFLVPLLLIISFGIIHAQNKTKHKHRTSKADPSARKTITKYGVASYYANKFNGRKTASGEIFISTKYTAACNIVPLNTWIKVTNLRNNKSVIVRVNDRLHLKNKRLVDLSKTGAKKLGYFGRGITKVKVEVLENYRP